MKQAFSVTEPVEVGAGDGSGGPTAPVETHQASRWGGARPA